MSMRSKPRWPAATQTCSRARSPFAQRRRRQLVVRAPLRPGRAVTDALRANDIDSARALMPDLRESHVAVLEALTNLEEWGLSTSMR